MSDSTDSGSNRNPLDPDDILDAGPDRGQQRDVVQDSGTSSASNDADYVDGDYGDAGKADNTGNTASGEEGQYTSGNFGSAGESEGSGAQQDEGEYPEGDYGEGGQSRIPSGSEPGGEGDAEYPEGDYGQAGQVGQEKYPETERPWEGS